MERRGFVVRGRVQGVGFRWWTQRTGVSLGLGGHVRNLADGTVEVHAAGPSERLDELEEALQRGPASARVEGVERIQADPRTPTDDFLMERW
ncbi:MAG: acylphosphatase [Gemmatimonadota bacterium]|jgi:acylphosphatase